MTQDTIPAPGRKRSEARRDTRELLVRAGTALLTEHSFAASGVERVLQYAGVPRGSFYHYFQSKEAFGQAVIENYADYFNRKLDRLLCDTSMSPLACLQAYIDDAKQAMVRFEFRRGCLIGNLSQELGPHSDIFRPLLEQVFLGWQQRVADCLRRAIEAGQVPATIDPAALAEFFWIGWEGALLRTKLTKSTEPIEKFALQFFRILS